MSKTNTNTNNAHNGYQISGRGGRGQGAPNGSDRGNCCNGHRNNLIVKYSFEEKTKDGLISKLIITETGHRPSQFKKIIDALPVLCTDKNYQGLNEVLHSRRDRFETEFMPAYLDATQWSITHHMQISTVNSTADAAPDGLQPLRYTIMQQTHVTDANLQKELLSQYKRNSKNKSQEYAKFLADKKFSITILFGQCDEATQTKIAFGTNYTENRDARRLLAFIEQMHTVCFGGDDGGLSYGPYIKL